MKTLLPSGVSIVPADATKLKVLVEPARLPAVQIIPVAGTASASALASSAATGTSAPAARARPASARRIRCKVLIVASCSDIGLAHDGLRGQRGLVHPHLGHHSARAGCTETGQPAPVPVLEVVDVVVAAPV